MKYHCLTFHAVEIMCVDHECFCQSSALWDPESLPDLTHGSCEVKQHTTKVFGGSGLKTVSTFQVGHQWCGGAAIRE